MKLHHINQYECISKASNIDVNFIREQASKQANKTTKVICLWQGKRRGGSQG
jgi:hypothetical protein